MDGAWEIKVHILETTREELDWRLYHRGRWCHPARAGRRSARPSGSVQRSLRRLVVEHRVELLAEWDAAQEGEGP